MVHQAFGFQLESHEGTLWFVLEPRVVVTTDGNTLAPVEQRRAVANRAMATVFNAQMHERLLSWIYYLASISQPISFALRDIVEVVSQIALDEHYAFSSSSEEG
jgi:hypothetical protein